MELAARIGTMASNDDSKKLAQDLIDLVSGKIEYVDWSFDIARTAAEKPFYGQTKLRSIRLRNVVIKRTNGFAYFFDGFDSILEELYLDKLTSVPNSFGRGFYNALRVVTPNLSPNETNGNTVRDFKGEWDVRPKTCEEILVMINGYAFSSNQPNTAIRFTCSDGNVVWDGSAWVAVPISANGVV